MIVNEITVKIKCSINEMIEILTKKGFRQVDKFILDDTYFIRKEIDITALSPREILNNYVLIRNITQYKPNFIDNYNIIKMTYKKKKIATNGDIISQDKVDCEIKSLEQGKNFLEAINYKRIMSIKENNIVYGKDGIEIAIKDIEGGDNLIEIETNDKLDTVDKIKQKINELQIPIYTEDYFVKKAEIELKKVLEIKND